MTTRIRTDVDISGFARADRVLRHVGLTTTERDALASPAAGMRIYNSTTNTLQDYDGAAWVDLGWSGEAGVIVRRSTNQTGVGASTNIAWNGTATVTTGSGITTSTNGFVLPADTGVYYVQGHIIGTNWSSLTTGRFVTRLVDATNTQYASSTSGEVRPVTTTAPNSGGALTVGFLDTAGAALDVRFRVAAATGTGQVNFNQSYMSAQRIA